MKKILLVAITVLLVECVQSQTRRSVRVRAGEDIAQAYSKHGFYRFPSFSKAKLYFRSGGHNEGVQFNYNILSSSLQFIGPKGDTLEVAGLAGIDSVVFEKGTYYFADGLVELAGKAGPLRLVKKTTIKLQAENIGAYGQPNPTSSIVNYNTYFSGINVYNLSVNQDVVIVETTNWFFLDEKNMLHKTSKSTLLSLLPDAMRSAAESYLKDNKTQFDKEADLQRLIAALSTAR